MFLRFRIDIAGDSKHYTRMDTNQANLMGYAVGARIALQHSDSEGVKKACANTRDLDTSVGEFVNMHASRMQKRASRVNALYQTICG